jgi:hypothetical protein
MVIAINSYDKAMGQGEKKLYDYSEWENDHFLMGSPNTNSREEKVLIGPV